MPDWLQQAKLEQLAGAELEPEPEPEQVAVRQIKMQLLPS
jgi:hypothetical protein